MKVKFLVIIVILMLLIFVSSASNAYYIAKGDLNEDSNITPTDILLLKRYLVDLETLSETQKTEADLNDDGKVTETDLLIEKKILTASLVWDKSVLYFYPTEETEINVKFGNENKITTSYPTYDKQDGWNFIAKSNGELIVTKDKKKFTYLSYSAINDFDKVFLQQNGFVIKGEDSSEILEEKLKILGLNDVEINNFIAFWVPRMERNKYNFIRFTEEEYIEENMPLEITPKPDKLIRIIMELKELDEPIDVEEQKLSVIKRDGYTVIECGGIEVKF